MYRFFLPWFFFLYNLKNTFEKKKIQIKNRGWMDKSLHQVTSEWLLQQVLSIPNLVCASRNSVKQTCLWLPACTMFLVFSHLLWRFSMKLRNLTSTRLAIETMSFCLFVFKRKRVYSVDAAIFLGATTTQYGLCRMTRGWIWGPTCTMTWNFLFSKMAEQWFCFSNNF